MKVFTPHFSLDNRHFLGLNGAPSDLVGSTGDPKLDHKLLEISNDTPSIEYPSLMAQHLITLGRMSRSGLDPHDLWMIHETVKEMYDSEMIFEPYKNFRKVSIFGSARTSQENPNYKVTKEFSRLLKESGFMVITGAGPGIMQAGNEGAGTDHSFGLSIKLPFESDSNPYIKHDKKHYEYHYFFVRKLYFLKESDAYVAFPGGFGTMDEVFESLTLMQTGKTTIYPLVLVDAPKQTFWKTWEKFVHKEFIESGLISESDLSLFYITQSAEKAVEHIKQFYKIFHSYRFIGNKLVIRLQKHIDPDFIDTLNEEFRDLISSSSMKLQKAMPEESDEPFLSMLPRIIFRAHIKEYGRLRQLIDRINQAPIATV